MFKPGYLVITLLMSGLVVAQGWDQTLCTGTNCLQQGSSDAQTSAAVQNLPLQAGNPAYQPCLENPAHPVCGGQIPGTFNPGQQLSGNPNSWTQQAQTQLAHSDVAWVAQPASRALGSDLAAYQNMQAQAQQMSAQQTLPCTSGQCWQSLLPPAVVQAADRSRTMTGLGLLQAMQAQHSTNGLSVFPGQYADCTDTGTVVGSSRCCQGGVGALQSFWGQSCSVTEKKIQQAKNAGTATWLGSWSSCSRKSLGVCLRHEQHYAFCLWPGVLARIVQEQGHAQWKQSVPWSCAGLSLQNPDQLAQIDFSHLNFSAYTASLKALSP